MSPRHVGHGRRGSHRTRDRHTDAPPAKPCWATRAGPLASPLDGTSGPTGALRSGAVDREGRAGGASSRRRRPDSHAIVDVHGGRPRPMTTDRAPDAVVVAARHDPGSAPSAAPARGARARPSSPARRCTPTTSSSRAPGTAPRSARPMPHATLRSRSSSTRPSTGRRSSSSPPTTSRATTSSALITDDQPILVPVGGEIQHQAEPRGPARRGRPRDAARGPAARVTLRTEPLRRSSTRSQSSDVFAHYELGQGRRRRGAGRGGPRHRGEYRVGHQEQLYIENNAMIAVPREDGGDDRPRLLQCPYYIHKALKRGPGPRRSRRPRSSRPRPAAASAARRSTRR